MPAPVRAMNGVWRTLLVLSFPAVCLLQMMGGTEHRGPRVDEVTPRCDTRRPNQNTPAAHAPLHQQPEHTVIVWFEHLDNTAHVEAIIRMQLIIGIYHLVIFSVLFSASCSDAQLLKKRHLKISSTIKTSCRSTEQQLMQLWSPPRCVTYRARRRPTYNIRPHCTETGA